MATILVYGVPENADLADIEEVLRSLVGKACSLSPEMIQVHFISDELRMSKGLTCSVMGLVYERPVKKFETALIELSGEIWKALQKFVASSGFSNILRIEVIAAPMLSGGYAWGKATQTLPTLKM